MLSALGKRTVTKYNLVLTRERDSHLSYHTKFVQWIQPTCPSILNRGETLKRLQETANYGEVELSTRNQYLWARWPPRARCWRFFEQLVLSPCNWVFIGCLHHKSTFLCIFKSKFNQHITGTVLVQIVKLTFNNFRDNDVNGEGVYSRAKGQLPWGPNEGNT